MPAFIDLTGQRFGRLLVLQRVPNVEKGLTRWLCKCDCGNTPTILRHLLRSGHTKSCGCYQKDCIRLQKGQAAFNQLYSAYSRTAKKRGYTFTLSQKDFKIITQKSCYYCGTLPKQGKRGRYSYGTYFYNGIDRIDNSKGYEPDNIVPCCGVCNNMKHAQSQDSFLTQISKIYKHKILKGSFND